MLGDEDHSLAQFWYSKSTLRVLTELCRGRECVALLSAPSVYFALDAQERSRATLLEYDRKWATPGVQFRFFDYEAPLSEAYQDLQGKCDLVIADPPRIQESVVEKYMQVIHMLLAPEGHIAFTSAMEHEFYFATCGLFSRKFIPKEAAGWAEAGRFRLYTNFSHACLDEENKEDFPDGGGSADSQEEWGGGGGWGYE